MRINEIMKRLNKVGPEVRLNQRGMDLLAGSRLSRKSAVYLQDVPLEDFEDLDPETQKLISKLKPGISVKNVVSGDNVNFNQDLAQINELIRRIAIKNQIDGNIVNTHQNLKEINSKKRKFTSFEEALEDLTNALKKVESSNQNNDGNVQQVTSALQRLAVQNNIKGNKVNTKQAVEEYNDELVAALAVMKMVGEKPTKSLNADFGDVEQALRRLAIKNNIKGVTVNTKQDISEYNDEFVSSIVEALRRLAVKNEISGGQVNTKQNIQEFNDNPAKAISNALQRLAVSNQITGNSVNTKQDISEVNNDEPQSLGTQDDAKVLKEIYKPFDNFVVKEKAPEESDDQLHTKVVSPPIFSRRSKSDEASRTAEDELQQAQQDFIDNGPRGIYYVDNPANSIVSGIKNIRTHEDQLRAQRFELLKRLQPSLFMDELETQGDESDDADDVDDDNEGDADDEEQENSAQAQQDENQEGSSRRMTINNNMNQRETRRLVLDNKISGKEVNTTLNATEHNTGPKKTKEKEPLPITSTTPANDVEASEKKPKTPRKEIICKTSKGKKISSADMKKFLELLEKLKAFHKNSDLKTKSK